MIIGATGHRPNKLGGYGRASRVELIKLARRHIAKRRPEKVITGMALGWDQAWAVAAHMEGVPFIAAVPFPGQDSRWPEESRVRYQRILERAAEVHVIAEFFSNRAMQKRNEWMVDNSDEMVALWDGTFGGTCNCIGYIEKRRKPWTNLWPQWSGDYEALLG